eukprot:1238577-Pyramimonas_sp.AAC.1
MTSNVDDLEISVNPEVNPSDLPPKASVDPIYILQWARAFNEVPEWIFKAESWSTILAAKVLGEANILCLEGDALLLAVKHLLRSGSNFGTRCLAFVDNLPLALAMAKGRAHAVHLQR